MQMQKFVDKSLKDGNEQYLFTYLINTNPDKENIAFFIHVYLNEDGYYVENVNIKVQYYNISVSEIGFWSAGGIFDLARRILDLESDLNQ